MEKLDKLPDIIKKRDIKKKLFKWLIYLLYLLLIALICGGIVMTILLMMSLTSNLGQADYINAVAGVGTSILTVALAIHALASLISSRSENKNKKQRELITAGEDLIYRFNAEYLEDYNIVTTIIERVNSQINLIPPFSCSLEMQSKNIKKMQNIKDGKYDDYSQVVTLKCCYRFVSINGLLNDMMRRYCEDVIQGKTKITNSLTIGRIEIDAIFRSKRIRILNFLEELALSYANENVDQDVVESQFFDMIKSTIPLFYYFIVNDEGLNCYPCLNALTKLIQ